MTSIISIALVLQLHNVAGAPLPVVSAATIELSRAYHAIDIDVDWSGGVARPGAIRIVVLPSETGALRHTADAVMGAAMRTANGLPLVYIFYERVRAEAERYGVSTALVLACAIEHELGHVLMPGGGHSTDGLMRACWRADEFRRADQGQLTFSRREAASIRARLSETLVEDQRGDRARE